MENHLRFAKEIREEVAKACGEDFPVAMRFSLKSIIKDWREGVFPGDKVEEKGRDIGKDVICYLLALQCSDQIVCC